MPITFKAAQRWLTRSSAGLLVLGCPHLWGQSGPVEGLAPWSFALEPIQMHLNPESVQIGLEPPLALPAEAITMSPGAVAQLEADLREIWATNPVPGAVLVVWRHDAPVLELALGRRSVDADAAVDESTLFNFGPLTHALTSLLALHLEEIGRISLNEPVHQWHAPFELTDPAAARQVTLRHLLSMTAGMPTYVDEILDPAWAQPDDLFLAMAQAPVIARPGRVREVSFLSVSVGGFLMAERFGTAGDPLRSFEALLMERIARPAGMAQATFVLGRDGPENLARPHREQDDGTYRVANRWEPERNPFSPALGLKGSMADLRAWIRLELSYGRLPDGGYLAGPSAFRRRWYGPSQGPGLRARGMGWMVRSSGELDLLFLGGSYDRQRAAIGLMPAYGFGFGILANADGPQATAMTEAMTQRLVAAIAEAEAAEARRRQLMAPPVASQPHQESLVP